jgi:hypothetical protein
LVHATGAPKWPVPSQVTTPLPAHWVVPTAHTPTHVPLTHVELVQAAGAPQVPPALHVCTPLPEH